MNNSAESSVAECLHERAFHHAAYVHWSSRPLRESLRIERLEQEIGALLRDLDANADHDRRVIARLYEALALCTYARGNGPRPVILEILLGLAPVPGGA